MNQTNLSDVLITFFLGWAGIHKFKSRNIVLGLVYLFTFGLFGIGWIVDSVIVIYRYIRRNHVSSTGVNVAPPPVYPTQTGINFPTENTNLTRIIPKCHDYKSDTLLVTTSKNCPVCGQYNKHIYSLYGWDKNYPPLPAFINQRTCPSCGKYIGVSFYFPGISSH